MTGSANERPEVLITGTSTGIGRATALLLDRSGYKVYAGVRKEKDADSLRSEASEHLHPLILDVTNEAHIAAAIAELRHELGPDRGLFCLINNAGTAEGGPLEIMALERMRRQFDINVFGAVAMTQAALPLLHQAKGRIINVVSPAAYCPMPFLGSYSGTKAALWAMSLSMRRELKWFGVKVSMIVPGFIKTDVWDAVRRTMDCVAQEDSSGQYLNLMNGLMEFVTGPGDKAAPPELVAKTMLQIVKAKNPRSTYRVGPGAALCVPGNYFPENLVHWVQQRHLRKKGSSAGIDAQTRRLAPAAPEPPEIMQPTPELAESPSR